MTVDGVNRQVHNTDLNTELLASKLNDQMYQLASQHVAACIKLNSLNVSTA
jgi:hypothetical protein